MVNLKYKTFWKEDELCEFINTNKLANSIKSITFRNGTGYVVYYLAVE